MICVRRKLFMLLSGSRQAISATGNALQGHNWRTLDARVDKCKLKSKEFLTLNSAWHVEKHPSKRAWLNKMNQSCNWEMTAQIYEVCQSHAQACRLQCNDYAGMQR